MEEGKELGHMTQPRNAVLKKTSAGKATYFDFCDGDNMKFLWPLLSSGDTLQLYF